MEGINAEERQRKRMHMVPGAAPCSGPGCPDANQMDMPRGSRRGKTNQVLGRMLDLIVDMGRDIGSLMELLALLEKSQRGCSCGPTDSS